MWHATHYRNYRKDATRDEDVEAEWADGVDEERYSVELRAKCSAAINAPERTGQRLEAVDAVFGIERRLEPGDVVDARRRRGCKTVVEGREGSGGMDNVVDGLLAQLHGG